MILPIQQALRARISAVLTSRFDLAPADQPALVAEMPPRRALGDLSFPFAFELARRLRRAPRAIAQEVADHLGALDGVTRIEVAGNGYLNVFLDRPAFLVGRLSPAGGATAASSAWPEKTIVEHTAINPNKAAHIGHLRNAALGDTLGRLLRFAGTPVEIQNYIDDTGVQVADVVVGLQALEGLSLDAVRAVADRTRFDHYCWDLYARVTQWYDADKSRLELRARTLHAIEEGHDESAAIGRLVAERIVGCHLETMRRLNIDYDLLSWEGDILRLRFWSTAFDILKANGSVFLQDQGPLAGCWVMRIDESPGDEAPDTGDTENDDERREKVIVRSNGTVTYVGKDIAYQFWKFGLLGKDFHYRVFTHRHDGSPLWATTTDDAAPQSGTGGVPPFGGAGRVFNVIDTRQSYLQQLLKQALWTMGHRREAERSTHFSYEMVALSHSTARELGYDASTDAGRPFVEVSGRKGLGVKADDLIDRLVAKAAHEVATRNPDLDAAGRDGIARAIAVAALRYFMVKFSRTKVIVFDIDEALAFEGESGPYLQYSVVRANNIFNKLRDRDGLDEAAVIAALGDTPAESIVSGDEADDVWHLVLEAGRLDEVVEQAIRTLEPSLVAKWMFGLAQLFNAFYHRYPILNEERADVRRWRAGIVAYFRRQLTQALGLFGCDVPARM